MHGEAELGARLEGQPDVLAHMLSLRVNGGKPTGKLTLGIESEPAFVPRLFDLRMIARASRAILVEMSRSWIGDAGVQS